MFPKEAEIRTDENSLLCKFIRVGIFTGKGNPLGQTQRCQKRWKAVFFNRSEIWAGRQELYVTVLEPRAGRARWSASSLNLQLASHLASLTPTLLGEMRKEIISAPSPCPLTDPHSIYHSSLVFKVSTYVLWV